jgi:predicted DNA-binding ribbon-helix-helix protein
VSAVRKRSIHLHGQKTSISLEDEFWDALREISEAKGERLPDTINAIDRSRSDGQSQFSDPAVRAPPLSTSPPAP